MAVYWWFTMVQFKKSLNKSKKICPILSREKTTKTHPTHPQTTCNCAGHSSLLGSTAIKRWKQPAAWNRCDVCFVTENFHHPKNGGKDWGEGCGGSIHSFFCSNVCIMWNGCEMDFLARPNPLPKVQHGMQNTLKRTALWSENPEVKPWRLKVMLWSAPFLNNMAWHCGIAAFKNSHRNYIVAFNFSNRLNQPHLHRPSNSLAKPECRVWQTCDWKNAQKNKLWHIMLSFLWLKFSSKVFLSKTQFDRRPTIWGFHGRQWAPDSNLIVRPNWEINENAVRAQTSPFHMTGLSSRLPTGPKPMPVEPK